MRSKHRWNMALLALTGALALPALAEAAALRCTEADKAKWLEPAAVKQLLQSHGFTGIGAIKSNANNCYVVPVTDQSGAKKTLYLDPTDGALMGME
jgi:hypothetical protein